MDEQYQEKDSAEDQEVIQEDVEVPESRSSIKEEKEGKKHQGLAAITNLFKPKPVTVEVVNEEPDNPLHLVLSSRSPAQMHCSTPGVPNFQFIIQASIRWMCFR